MFRTELERDAGNGHLVYDAVGDNPMTPLLGIHYLPHRHRPIDGWWPCRKSGSGDAGVHRGCDELLVWSVHSGSATHLIRDHEQDQYQQVITEQETEDLLRRDV